MFGNLYQPITLNNMLRKINGINLKLARGDYSSKEIISCPNCLPINEHHGIQPSIHPIADLILSLPSQSTHTKYQYLDIIHRDICQLIATFVTISFYTNCSNCNDKIFYENEYYLLMNYKDLFCRSVYYYPLKANGILSISNTDNLRIFCAFCTENCLKRCKGGKKVYDRWCQDLFNDEYTVKCNMFEIPSINQGHCLLHDKLDMVGCDSCGQQFEYEQLRECDRCSQFICGQCIRREKKCALCKLPPMEITVCKRCINSICSICKLYGAPWKDNNIIEKEEYTQHRIRQTKYDRKQEVKYVPKQKKYALNRRRINENYSKIVKQRELSKQSYKNS